MTPAYGLTVWVATSISPELGVYFVLGVRHAADDARSLCAADAASIMTTMGAWEPDTATESGSEARQAFQTVPGKDDQTFWRIEEFEVRSW